MEAVKPNVERQSISLTADLLSAAKKFAEQERKTFSGVVVDALTAHLRSHSALPEQATEEEQLLAAVRRYGLTDEVRELITAAAVSEAEAAC